MRVLSLAIALAQGSCHDWSALSEGSSGPAGPSSREPTCPAYVVAGATHTCTRTTNGKVFCWGDNRFGQLGSGDRAPQTGPVEVALPEGASKVYLPATADITSDRGLYTCVLTTGSALYCFGDNREGQLATGDTAERFGPVRIEGIGPVDRASIGAGHACVKTQSNAMWCWGANEQGQLATGDTTSRLVTTAVETSDFETTTEAVALGFTHTCMQKTSGGVFCVGGNEFGQLASSQPSNATVPVEVTTVRGFSRVVSGANHICALSSEGTISCWGDNRFGQLGVGDNAPHDGPVAVAATDMGPVAQVIAGGTFTCALDIVGGLWCWGDNRSGQLGTGDTNPRSAPTRITSPHPENAIAAASAGSAHTCAVLRDASVWCWGNNQFGQISSSANAFNPNPVEVIQACR